MPRKPTKTVRVDEQTHKELRWLATWFTKDTGRYHSLTDIVRVGLTLSVIELERREHARERHRASAGGDEGVLSV